MTTKTTDFRWVNYSTQVGFAGQAAIDSPFAPPVGGSYTSSENTFTGVENRNWRSQVRHGSNATTVASGETYQRFGLPPQYYCFGYVGSSTSAANARRQSLCTGQIPILGASLGSNEEVAAINNARIDFSKHVGHIYTSFQGGVFLGELRETLHMIRRPAQSLRKRVGEYLADVQKNARRLKRLPKPAREKWVSNTYLEYSFGWAPLLSDLDDARKYLQRRQDILFKEIKTTKGVASVRALRDETLQSTTVGPATLIRSRRYVDTYTCVYAGGVASTATGRTLVNASAMGLSARNFVPTLWELIPWSFVIDYFSNIGDVIEAWSNQRINLAWGRETIVRERRADFINQRGVNSLTKEVEAIFIPSSQVMLSKRFNRSPISSPPLPSVSFEIPGFGIKWVNLAALTAARRNLNKLRLWD